MTFDLLNQECAIKYTEFQYWLYFKEERHLLFLNREDGQGLVEYALILVLVAIVVIAILALLGPQIGNVFSRIVNALGGAG